MYQFVRNKVLVGIILYLIPTSLSFLVFRFFSWIIEPKRSIENAIYAYGIFIVLILASFIGGYILAKTKKKRSWAFRFFFAVISTVLSIHVFVLSAMGLGIIGIQNKLIKSKWVSEKRKDKIKNSKFGCLMTSILAGMLAFSNLLFVVEKGNIRAFRSIHKAIVVFNHLSSGDYFIAAMVAIFKNWRVMIGANLWKYKGLHWFFDIVGIPIAREEEALRERVKAVNLSKNFLNSNEKALLGIFAEGTRNREPENGLNEYQMGAFVLACKLGKPVIPAVIAYTNKWRAPWEQDITSHNKDDQKLNYFKLFLSFAKQYYKTGINPTIAYVIYGNPISTVGKTPEQVKVEVELVTKELYRKHTTRKKIRRGKKRKMRV